MEYKEEILMLRLEPDLKRKLREVAKKNQRTMSAQVRTWIIYYGGLGPLSADGLNQVDEAGAQKVQ